MAEPTRRYSIRLVDIEVDQDVMFTVVDWTDEEKRAAVEQICRRDGGWLRLASCRGRFTSMDGSPFASRR
jgi:hypothetical protein